MKLLSVLIATIDERKPMLDKLLSEFNGQIAESGLEELTEIIVKSDNREMTIGSKRQWLLENCNGKWIMYSDDDDWPMKYYVHEVVNAILQAENEGADCIGIHGIMTTNGANLKTWVHRLGMSIATNVGPWNYTRPIIHFNPVLKEKALMAGFDKSLRFGEDMDYGLRLAKYLTKEVFIKLPLFHYKYTTHVEHDKKYGIA